MKRIIKKKSNFIKMFVAELKEHFYLRKTCRLCLNPSNKLISIFDISDLEIQYSIIITECTSLKISESDQLPKSICLKCVEDLNKFYNFRKLVVNSQLRLNDFLNKFSNNLNNDLKVGSTSNINEEADSNEETTNPFKNEEDLHYIEGNLEVIENKFNVLEEKIKIEENELPIVAPFSVKSENFLDLEVENKIETVEEKLVTDENETHDYEKVDHITSSNRLIRNKKSNIKSEKRYNYKQCGKSFITSTELKIHERLHTGERYYNCAQCGKSFRQISSLKIHGRQHTGEKPYNCKECGKSFSISSNLRRHERIHTGEKRYTRKERAKSFITSAKLKIYESQHTDKCHNLLIEPRH